MLILKILGIWTVLSVITSFIVAPALSRRLRDANFRDENEWSGTDDDGREDSREAGRWMNGAHRTEAGAGHEDGRRLL